MGRRTEAKNITKERKADIVELSAIGVKRSGVVEHFEIILLIL